MNQQNKLVMKDDIMFKAFFSRTGNEKFLKAFLTALLGKELNIKTGGRKAIKLPEEELLNKYIENDSLRALAKAYGCSYEVLRRNLKEYIGEENWQTYVRNKRGRGEKNREVTLDDIKIVYRRAFAEEIKQIITLKETKEEEKPKVKSLGRK